MKKIIFQFSFLLAAVISVAQTNNGPANGPVITFTETSFDFGDIYQGDTVSHIFKFKNSGTAPLIISEVKTTCGCTAPFYSKEPVLPGKSGEIKIVFNSAGKSGRLPKVVTVISNATNSTSRFSFVVNVLPPR